jgi:excisionase family DNA binding protein
MTVAAAAEALGCSEQYVRQLLAAGRLRGKLHGEGHNRFWDVRPGPDGRPVVRKSKRGRGRPRKRAG